MNRKMNNFSKFIYLGIIFILFVSVFSVYAENTENKVVSDSIRVVKGQVSNYYIPVINEYIVKGKVTDATGKPLQGATVMYFASSKHCNTDADGEFSLKSTDNETHLYVYYPEFGFNHIIRDKETHDVDIVLKKEKLSTFVLPRNRAVNTKWFDPYNQSVTTYCNPLNIAYNYEPYNSNVKDGGCFRSAADPMALVYGGLYLLFATNQGGYFQSHNLSDWDFTTATFQRYPTDDDQCAPAAFVAGDTLFYTGSTYEGLPIWFSTAPEQGRWRCAVMKNKLPSWDPCLFLDDDGKLYLYYGSSNEYPLKAVELSRNDFSPVSKIYDVVILNPREHGWERFGMNNDDEITLKPFAEGAYMTKHDGKYYLQYGAPGTEFKTYADGVYVGDSPLGPFVYQKHNPMSYKPGGFIQGVGHGGTFQDLYGQYWHVGTCMLSLKYKFERRIGLYPVYFDKDGVMYSNTAFGDYPMKNADYMGSDRFTGWMLLSLNKKVTCSSTDTLDINNVSDDNIRTYWSAKTGEPGEWIEMDLGKVSDVRAIQVNFYDHHTNQTNRANDLYYQYRIYSSDDGKNWKLVVDKSDNDRDVPHDYVELKCPLRTRYLKLLNLHMAGGSQFCLSDFRVFGLVKGKLPDKVIYFSVKRDEKDKRNAHISWQPSKGAYGYNIYYGIAPDKLYNCITVYGSTSYDFRGLDIDSSYYFTVEALGETGRSEQHKTIKI